MKFLVFKNGKTIEDFPLYGAYLFGADKVPVRDCEQITFQDGMIQCKKKTPEAAGLALLWPVEGFGKVLLSTTRLQKRERPYILNVELARAQLMQITVKREDWSLFEETDSFADLAHEAQGLFVEALQNISDPSKASILADQSLQKAIVFSEKLSAAHADQLFNTRLKSRHLGTHSIGCQLDPARINEEGYVKKLLENFGFITIPVNWGQIEPESEKYDFGSLDKCFDVLGDKKIILCLGPLLCFSPISLPKWLLESEGNFEKVREKSYQFVSKIVNRYARFVHIWRVICGMNALNHFGFNFEQILEMTRTAALAAKAAGTGSLKMVEIIFPWGEYYAYNPNTIPPLVYLDMVMQSGITLDAFGLQMLFGVDHPGMHVRDMMQISAMLDRFAPLTKPLHITSFGVPDNSIPKGQGPEQAGVWHNAWNRRLQAEWIKQFAAVALSKPFINTITCASFADGASDCVTGSGLLTADLKPKEAYEILAKMQKNIHEG